eukprot:Phypoly_transcript_15347.p1 GENE.Phypoly_transcript_15347~~Phypoly_transcript_15347.p1  ORF type:complete len:266 (-),score=6.43 Phypoly_transcript_15347:95-892(-)
MHESPAVFYFVKSPGKILLKKTRRQNKRSPSLFRADQACNATMIPLTRIRRAMSNPGIKRTGVPPPRRVTSQDNEGDVYLFIHGIDSAHSATMPNYDIEHAHFSIIIDIAGESHGEIVSGYEIYIGILDWTTPVARFFFPKWTRRICRRGLEVRCLGKIPGLPTTGAYEDHVFTWKQGMDKHATTVYQNMISASNSRAWSSRINCQQFARELTLSLNLVWPIDVPMASGDAVPAMFDRDMLLYSIPKRFQNADETAGQRDSCLIS